MAFTFKLQALLKHRGFMLREAQVALGAAEQLKMEIESRIEAMKGNIEARHGDFENEQCRGILVDQYLDFKHYLFVLERQLSELETEFVNASVQAEEQRARVIEKDVSVKLVENLKRRAVEAHAIAQSRKENKKSDEIAIVKEFRKRNAL